MPDTSKQARHRTILRVQGKKGPRSDRWVTIYLGNKKTELFAGTGSRFYHSRMGQVKEAKCILRAWGSNKTLDGGRLGP